MQRFFTLFTFHILLAASLAAQSVTDTFLVKAAQPKTVITAKSIDQKINESIQPITNVVEQVIFYSFKVSNDIQYYTRKANEPTAYTKTPPFTISYNNIGGYYGTEFTVTAAGGNQYILEYPYTDAKGNQYSISGVYTYNEAIKIGNGTMQINVADTENIFEPYHFKISEVKVPFVLVWLIGGAVFFTLYFKFFNLRGFGLALNIVRGKYSKKNESGEVSHFQALATALSGTVGLGNIAGVAVAITIGGPGATFWMIVAGLLGMSSKFVECTLGVAYRNVGKDGKVYGGPMYYLSKGFKEKGWSGLGKFLAIFFAIMCIGGAMGGGNMFQINQAFRQAEYVTGGETGILHGYGWLFGIVVSLLTGIVIIGGIKRIARLTDKMVPFMCGIYVLAGIIIVLVNATEVPHALVLIFKGAFIPEAVAGGAIGALIQGFRRAAFSNEAGIGSASIAHSAVRTNHPASEGIVSLLEPFIDTVIVCTMTAVVLIVTGYYNYEGAQGVTLTSVAFESVFPFFRYILAGIVFLFAFSTMISWSYYGLQSWHYLFGEGKRIGYIYQIIFCLFIIIGAAMELGPVIGFSDAMIFAMCFPNIIGLIILLPRVKQELHKYLSKIKSGEIVRNK